MLTPEDVLQLNEQVGSANVLSVYLAAEEHDPAERRGWRVRLNQMIRTLKDSLDTEREGELEAIERAFALIDAELRPYGGQLPGRGWVGYATADRLLHGGSSAAPMPDLVRWEPGVHVAPYVRALKQARPVVVAVADQREARIYRYQFDTLEQQEILHSRQPPGDDLDGSSKRAATHSGVRGEPRSDSAQRLKEVAAQRLMRHVVDHLTGLRGDGALFVLAGSFEMCTGIQRNLPESVRARAIEVSELPAHATEAEIRTAVDTAASTLSARLQLQLVEEVIDATRSSGRGCLGAEPAKRALAMGAVDTLVVSRTLCRNSPDLTNSLFWNALEQGAAVEEVSDAAAERLDEVGGIGARLRFAV